MPYTYASSEKKHALGDRYSILKLQYIQRCTITAFSIYPFDVLVFFCVLCKISIIAIYTHFKKIHAVCICKNIVKLHHCQRSINPLFNIYSFHISVFFCTACKIFINAILYIKILYYICYIINATYSSEKQSNNSKSCCSDCNN